MSKTSDDDKNRWDQVMESFGMLFAQRNDISLIQQGLKTKFKATKEEQKLIVQQIKATGQAVADLTLR